MKKTTSPYGTVKYKTIDEYHAAQEESIQPLLEHMREIIKSVVPHASETISYNMPAFKQNKVLVYYAANKNHLGFYPTSSPIVFFAEELKKYNTSKGAIQFPLGEKLPVQLIKKIVKHRMQEDKK